MIKIASWNVNSLKVRLLHVLDWMKNHDVDVLLLQETKVIDSDFPGDAFKELGYHIVFSGEKTYNGVAIISRFPLKDTIVAFPNYADPSKRILAATIGDLRLINFYVPNGADITSDKYQYKLTWLKEATHFLSDELKHHSNVIVGGDFNIAPTDEDVHEPMLWENSVLTASEVREAFNILKDLGFEDSFRLFSREEKHYSWWDYRAGSFRRNNGLRIDLLLLSRELSSVCVEASIDPEPRRWERPSDHAPILVVLDKKIS